MEVYIDNARTTPIAKEVLEAMIPYLTEKYGSPAAIHRKAMEAYTAMEDAQESIGRFIGAKERDEIVFTSGGTESNNLAIMGVCYANKDVGNHIITTKIEHPSVLKVYKALEENGYSADYIDVNPEGIVNISDLANSISKDTILVSVIAVSDIIGTIEPLKEVIAVVREKEEEIGHKIYIHVDAIQAFTKMKIDVYDMDIDLMSMSSHTIHGPKGIGALFVKKGTRIKPIMHGGMVVSALRPAIENIAGIVGFRVAVEIGMSSMVETWDHVASLQKRLYNGIIENIPEVQLNGPTIDSGKRSPYNLNITFNYVEGESIALMLDAVGIYVATGSACASQILKPNYVILALGKNAEDAHGSIRFSFSRYNTIEEVDYIIEKLPTVISSLRELSPVWPEKSRGIKIRSGS